MIEEGQELYFVAFFALAVTLVVLFIRIRSTEGVTITTKEFKQFQASYLTAYGAVLLCELLSSASFYHSFLYLELSIDQIARLYVVSIISTAVFSMLLDIIDIFSSKRDKCIFCAILYAVSMFSLFLGPHYEMLLFGRVIYGAAAALQQTGFESYGIHEHANRGFPDDWLGQTFTYLSHSMALIAALTGVLGQTSVASGPLGCIGLCCTIFILAAIYMGFTWTKDTNNPRFGVSGYISSMTKVGTALKTQKPYMYLVVLTCCFESSILLFTFYWAPWMMSLLPSTDNHLPYEMVFSCLVMASMVGNYCYQLMQTNANSQQGKFNFESTFQSVLIASSASFFFGAIVGTPVLAFVASLCVNACVGVYWPCVGLLRGDIVMPELRSHTMTVTRLVTAVVTLTCFHWILAHQSAFGMLSICATLNAIAALAHHKIVTSESYGANTEDIEDNDA